MKATHLILKDFGIWWKKFGKIDSITKKFAAPTAEDVEHWWKLDPLRKKRKETKKRLCLSCKRIHYFENKRKERNEGIQFKFSKILDF